MGSLFGQRAFFDGDFGRLFHLDQRSEGRNGLPQSQPFDLLAFKLYVPVERDRIGEGDLVCLRPMRISFGGRDRFRGVQREKMDAESPPWLAGGRSHRRGQRRIRELLFHL